MTGKREITKAKRKGNKESKGKKTEVVLQCCI
jgi:hypothetical protein